MDRRAGVATQRGGGGGVRADRAQDVGFVAPQQLNTLKRDLDLTTRA